MIAEYQPITLPEAAEALYLMLYAICQQIKRSEMQRSRRLKISTQVDQRTRDEYDRVECALCCSMDGSARNQGIPARGDYSESIAGHSPARHWLQDGWIMISYSGLAATNILQSPGASTRPRVEIRDASLSSGGPVQTTS